MRGVLRGSVFHNTLWHVKLHKCRTSDGPSHQNNKRKKPPPHQVRSQKGPSPRRQIQSKKNPAKSMGMWEETEAQAQHTRKACDEEAEECSLRETVAEESRRCQSEQNEIQAEGSTEPSLRQVRNQKVRVQQIQWKETNSMSMWEETEKSKKVHHVETSMGRQRSQKRSIMWRCQWVVKGVKGGPSCGDVNGSSKESKKVHHVKTSMGRQRSQRRSITWRCQWVVKGVKGRSSCGDVNGSSKESKKVHHRKTSMDRQSVVKVDKKVFIKIFLKKVLKKIFLKKSIEKSFEKRFWKKVLKKGFHHNLRITVRTYGTSQTVRTVCAKTRSTPPRFNKQKQIAGRSRLKEVGVFRWWRRKIKTFYH